MYSGLYFCILQTTDTLTQILFSFGLGSPLSHCIPPRSFYVAFHGVDDIKRFNPIPCLPTYSGLIKSYATFTACSCDLLHVRAVDQKIRPTRKICASRENKLTIGPGKTIGVEPQTQRQGAYSRRKTHSYCKPRMTHRRFRIKQSPPCSNTNAKKWYTSVVARVSCQETLTGTV